MTPYDHSDPGGHRQGQAFASTVARPVADKLRTEGGWRRRWQSCGLTTAGKCLISHFMQAMPPHQPVGMAESLAALRGLRPELTQHGVGRLWLFGSRARQDTRPGSDWDVLVEFTQPPGLEVYMNLKFLLEEKLGGPVDLVSRAACKPRFLAAIKDELLDVA